ncbi:putative peptidase aspartic protein [Lasiodiplodia theobromae]|uniref:Peptidase aspartic protein n=1 Tax=Lasiodiplodia theobromae TaxID=45133 RepID=A0A8H7IR12_9PEZI|nr:putative peptidase aspartic protein [Lasiodiplodia theobromae]
MPARPTPIPSPYSLSPADRWDGVDGNWTAFQISVGTPHPQDFRVLISTRGSAPWVPIPDACNGFDSNCPTLRGVEPYLNRPSPGFLRNKSESWTNLSTYDLPLETDHGWTGNGLFGYDKVSLGYNGNSKALAVNNTLVVGMNSTSYWMGLLGIGRTNIGVDGGPDIDSFISNLKKQGIIPSLSYGYTAGAIYHNKGVPGSLVLGGYDQSRFDPPKFNFSFAKATDNTLQVGIQSITTSVSLGSQTEVNLLPSGPGEAGPLAYVDSTISQLWLPENICAKFEDAFGLVFNDSFNAYLVNDTLHKRLKDLNPSLTFQLGNMNVPNENNTSITLPYAAFDLWKTPLGPNSPPLRYFPLRRAKNDDQITIGRVFLQEAYLVVDHEQERFSLSQAKFTESMPPPDIRTIYPTDMVPPSAEHGLSVGAKAGIAIATVLVLLIIVAAVLFCCWWKPRRQEKGRSRGASIATSTAPTYQEKYDQQPPGYTALAEDSRNNNGNHNRNKSGETWVEMPAEQVERRPELEGTQGLSYELADNHEPGAVHEMEANTGENSATNEQATDGGGKVSSEKTGNKKRGRRASIVPF